MHSRTLKAHIYGVSSKPNGAEKQARFFKEKQYKQNNMPPSNQGSDLEECREVCQPKYLPVQFYHDV